jgi:phosphoglycerate dehydrogenase-like enzyme
MKAVLQYRLSPDRRRRLAEARPDGLDVVVVDERDKPAFSVEMRDADVLLHVLEPVSRAVIEAAPRLKLVQKIGVGVNTIDLDACRDHGVTVANMPGTNSQAVAEHTLALMLAVLRRTVDLDRATRAGRGWSLEAATLDRAGEIAGRTIGLLGFGDVARRLAPALNALGARVLCHTRTERQVEGAEPVSLAELLRRSDILSLHVPLTRDTERLIDRSALERMKPGSILINTARGALVDEVSLVDALKSSHLRGAGLDVFAAEPAAADHALFALDNVVVSPHIAWLTPETFDRSLTVAFDNCRRLAGGERLLHTVPPEPARRSAI